MRLLLIRHAQTAANASGVIDTAPPGPPLSEHGRRQAEALVDRLADQPIAAIYVSTLVRTAQTAAPLAAARSLDASSIVGIDEVRAGVYEGRGDPEAIEGYVGMLLRWYAGDFAASVPKGADEFTIDGVHFLRDYDAAMHQLVARHPDQCIAVFSHGAAIRAWVAHRAVNATSFGEALRVFDNTGIARLEHGKQGWRLLEWEGRVGEALTEPGTEGRPAPTGDSNAA